MLTKKNYFFDFESRTKKLCLYYRFGDKIVYKIFIQSFDVLKYYATLMEIIYLKLLIKIKVILHNYKALQLLYTIPLQNHSEKYQYFCFHWFSSP